MANAKLLHTSKIGSHPVAARFFSYGVLLLPFNKPAAAAAVYSSSIIIIYGSSSAYPCVPTYIIVYNVPAWFFLKFFFFHLSRPSVCKSLIVRLSPPSIVRTALFNPVVVVVVVVLQRPRDPDTRLASAAGKPCQWWKTLRSYARVVCECVCVCVCVSVCVCVLIFFFFFWERMCYLTEDCVSS